MELEENPGSLIRSQGKEKRGNHPPQIYIIWKLQTYHLPIGLMLKRNFMNASNWDLVVSCSIPGS
jgi:hypothetical protein